MIQDLGVGTAPIVVWLKAAGASPARSPLDSARGTTICSSSWRDGSPAWESPGGNRGTTTCGVRAACAEVAHENGKPYLGVGTAPIGVCHKATGALPARIPFDSARGPQHVATLGGVGTSPGVIQVACEAVQHVVPVATSAKVAHENAARYLGAGDGDVEKRKYNAENYRSPATHHPRKRRTTSRGWGRGRRKIEVGLRRSGTN